MKTSIAKVTAALAFTLLFLTCSTQLSLALDLPDLTEFKRKAAAEGKVALGELAIFKDTYFADVTIQAPEVSSDGSISGTTTIAGRESRIVLHYVESNAGSRRWMLAMKLPTEKLGDLAPALQGSIADQLQLQTPILVFAKQSTKLRSASMTPEVRRFYQDVYGSDSFEVTLEDGVNLLTSASAQTSIKASAQVIGIDLESLVLEGVILKDFDSTEFKAAQKQGRLANAMGKSSELRARLQNLELKGFPKDFEIRDLALLVTGKPTVGLEFYMTVGSGSDERDFRCQSNFQVASASNGGRQGISISAQSDVDQPWRNALGIDGLEMRQLTLEIRYERIKNASPSASIAIQGQMRFGDKFVEVSGGMQSRSGVTIGFFKGSLNSLTRDDLVAVVNDMNAAASNHRGEKIDPNSLPEFEFRDVEFNYAPLGGSADLGIKSGIGLKGRLFMFGSELARVDALADATKPLITFNANVNRFDIGPVALHDCKLDVRMSRANDSHFRFKGGARIMSVEGSAVADLGAKQSMVTMSGKLADAFAVDLLFKTPSLDDPSWEFEGSFEDNFTQQLGQQVAGDLRAWAEKTKADFAKVDSDLEKAKQDVNRLNGEIARVRQVVEAERVQHKAALTRAQQDVQKIDGDIARMRRQVQSERDRHLGGIRSAEQKVKQLQSSIDSLRAEVNAQRVRDIAVHKRDMDNAKRSYDSAERDFKSAYNAWKREKNPIKKVKLGVTKDAKGVARDARKGVYFAAKKKYDVAKAAINKIPVDADPRIAAIIGSKKAAEATLQQARRAYQKATGGIPLDADPRIAALFAARDTALATVRATQSAFELAHRAPVDADPRLISLFTARDTATAALNQAQSAVSVAGDATQLATEVLASVAAGDVISIQSARIYGKVDAYERGGKVELEAQVRILNQPQKLRLAVDSKQLTNGNVFDQLASAAVSRVTDK